MKNVRETKMKKIICMLVGMLMIAGVVFCEETVEEKTKDDVKPQIEFFINQDLKKNKNTISELSLQLPAVDKMNLYNSYKKDALSPFLWNTLVGFGVGSYLDGDLLGGIVGSCLDGLGIVVGIWAWIDYSVHLEKYEKQISDYVNSRSLYYRLPLGEIPDSANVSTEETKYLPKHAPYYHFEIPLICFAIARLYEGTRAFRFVKKYNKQLTEALNLNSLTTSLLPVINPDGSFAMLWNVSITL